VSVRVVVSQSDAIEIVVIEVYGGGRVVAGQVHVCIIILDYLSIFEG
jgi:hypothetical protein